MGKTNISWCTHSLNLQKWHCQKISAGCKNCYALAMAARFPNNASEKPELRDLATIEREVAAIPSGAWVFLGDMYDVFLEGTPEKNINAHFDAVWERPDVNWMMLTKRPVGALKYLRANPGSCPDNLWFGVSVENKATLRRIRVLKDIPARYKFASFEPLLEPVHDHLHYHGARWLDFAIVGGESGPNRRPFNKAWARGLRDYFRDREGREIDQTWRTVFHFKQGSALRPGEDYLLDGVEYRPLPDGSDKADRPERTRIALQRLPGF